MEINSKTYDLEDYREELVNNENEIKKIFSHQKRVYDATLNKFNEAKDEIKNLRRELDEVKKQPPSTLNKQFEDDVMEKLNELLEVKNLLRKTTSSKSEKKMCTYQMILNFLETIEEIKQIRESDMKNLNEKIKSLEETIENKIRKQENQIKQNENVATMQQSDDKILQLKKDVANHQNYIEKLENELKAKDEEQTSQIDCLNSIITDLYQKNEKYKIEMLKMEKEMKAKDREQTSQVEALNSIIADLYRKNQSCDCITVEEHGSTETLGKPKT